MGLSYHIQDIVDQLKVVSAYLVTANRTSISTDSPDHTRGGVAHGGIFGFNVFMVVVDATINLIVVFTSQLL